MAVTKIGNYWYDSSGNRWFMHEPVKVGDEVECTTNSSSTYVRGNRVTIESIALGAYDYKYVTKPGERQSYDPVYYQNFTCDGNPRARSMKNWKKVEKTMAQLALESNDPCIVQEIKETVKDGKTVVENIGDPIPMDNMSAARIYTTEQITQSIREKNEYRQFYIYQRRHIARAKKPEIEFA